MPPPAILPGKVGALAALTALLGLAFAAPTGAQDEPLSEPGRARELFLKNCASCHGENGDGKGTAELDRPARSFQDGGFSFGNTPEALFKTISTGIPGSPMAGFDSSLTVEERRLLADYVVTLGPPVEEVKEADMILAVHDVPVVVRGLLPALGEGLPQHPRGLLVGDPSGITFEYQADDVRLLALRQGGFVKRTDWTGRGGTPLEPLGRVVHLVEGGKPEATFRRDGKELAARLSGTMVRRDTRSAAIEYHLADASGELAHVTEVPSVRTTPFGTGYERAFSLKPTAAATLTAHTPSFGTATVLAGDDARGWQVVRGADGPPVLVALEASRGASKPTRNTQGQLEATLALKPGGSSCDFAVWTVLLVDWDDEVRAQVERWCQEL